MERLVTCSLVLVAGLSASAQSIYIPPDYFGEDYKKSIGFWENKGQVVDTQGHPAKDVLFYSEGGMPRAYLRERSQVSFVVAHVDTNIATLDTLYRLDMRPYGPHAQAVSPVSFVQKDWVQNFYLPQCGASGVTDVLGYSRVVYPEIFPKIDMHFYSGGAGQKMAFVMRPGCDPSDLQLAFTGQDSIKVDLWGSLKIYYNGKYMEMPFAQAYQVGTGNTIIPVSWVPSYNVNNGVVSFQYSSYNPSLPLVFQVGGPPAPGTYEETGLCWSTYFGGDNTTIIHESAKDNVNRYFVGGSTSSTWSTFPHQIGQITLATGTVSFVSGFSTSDHLNWTTYLGGVASSMGETQGLVATNEGVYVGGPIGYSFIPLQYGSVAYYQATCSGNASFLAKLNPDDNGHVVRSTFLGAGSTQISGMGWDKYLYITGSTFGTLPTVQLPFGTTPFSYSGGEDGFLVILDDEDRTRYATFLGGTDVDRPVEVRAGDVNGSPHAVITGFTGSASIQDVPCTGNTYCQPWSGAYQESFIMEFDQYGALLWSTYMGFSSPIWDNALALDPLTGDVVIGPYAPIGLNVVPGPGWHLDTHVGTSSCLARFAAADRSLIWLTYVHGEIVNNQGPEVHIRSLQFDDAGYLYVGGHAYGNGLPVQSTAGEYESDTPYPNSGPAGGDFNFLGDAFALRFTPGQELDWGTYFGGNGAGYDMYSEVIYTLLPRNGGLYAGGVHAKALTATTTYFPLTKEVGATPTSTTCIKVGHKVSSWISVPRHRSG